MRRIMVDAGLTICSVHQPAMLLFTDPDRCIDNVHALGATVCVHPSPREVDFASAESVDGWIKRIAEVARKLAAAGIKLAYHNHGIEFVKVRGVTVLERLYREIPATELAAELDTYWIQYGGGNPLTWVQAMEGRLATLHLKDYAFTPEGAPRFAELGQGTLPLRAIIAAAESAGCPWFIVEQDTCPGDPFVSLEQSFDFLRTITSD